MTISLKLITHVRFMLGAIGLAMVLSSCGGDQTTEAVDDGRTATDDPTEAVDGQAVYVRTCSACHGEAGSGGPGGRLEGLELTLDQAILVITDGARPMPAFEGSLTAKEIEAVSVHVMSFADS